MLPAPSPRMHSTWIFCFLWIMLLSFLLLQEYSTPIPPHLQIVNQMSTYSRRLSEMPVFRKFLSLNCHSFNYFQPVLAYFPPISFLLQISGFPIYLCTGISDSPPNTCDMIKGNESDVANMILSSNVLHCLEIQRFAHIFGTRFRIAMGFRTKCRILNRQVDYIENSKLNIADMWLISLILAHRTP